MNYWYITPEYKIYIGGLNEEDRHVFKIVSKMTLELVEPACNPPTRCYRASAMPEGQKKILDPSQISGEWNWYSNGIDLDHPIILRGDGSTLINHINVSSWKIEPDGMIFIGG